MRARESKDEPALPPAAARLLSMRDYPALLFRAVQRSLEDQITDAAAAIAYYLFLAIPAMLLVAVGVFSVFAGRGAVEAIVARVATVAPAETVSLLEDSLQRTTEGRGGLAMIVVGGAVALWTATSGMTAVMRALNSVDARAETRGFLRRRLIALVMVLFALFALALDFGLLVLGPKSSAWLGRAVGMESLLGWIWWTVQWPILVLGLLLAFAMILWVGPSARRPWRFVSVGSAVAVVVWLLGSSAFAVYVSKLGSYNEAWGSLAAAIILLTWVWLGALSLLFAAEVNAEVERSVAARPA